MGPKNEIVDRVQEEKEEEEEEEKEESEPCNNRGNK